MILSTSVYSVYPSLVSRETNQTILWILHSHDLTMTSPGPAFQEYTGSCHENVSAPKAVSSNLRSVLAQIEIVAISVHYQPPYNPLLLTYVTKITSRTEFRKLECNHAQLYWKQLEKLISIPKCRVPKTAYFLWITPSRKPCGHTWRSYVNHSKNWV